MKKFILSALLPFLYFLYSLFPLAWQPIPAQANPHSTSPKAGDYACILQDDVFFYSVRDEKYGIFLLPKTYYVKVLELAPDFCKIEYLYDGEYCEKLVGYAQTAQLTFVNYVPQNPYLLYTFSVNYTLDSEEVSDAFLNQITLTCAYYGDYKIGSKTYCYVLRGDTYGYLKKPSDLRYPENTEYAERLNGGEEIPPTDNAKNSSSNPAQIAILIVLCLLIPVLASLILKPSKHPPINFDD